MAKVAIIVYSTYGHILGLAKTIQKTIEQSGSTLDLYQVAETLPEQVLSAIHAPAKDDSIPIVKPDDLTQYDAFLFGFPTRFGNVPLQVSTFVDQLGGLWASGALYQKAAGVFVSTGTQGGGQEITVRNFLSFLTHHGIIYIPLGYGNAFPLLTSFDEVHGGSPWGAGTFAGGDGSRQPNETELGIAVKQAENFIAVVNKLAGGKTETKLDDVVTKKLDTAQEKTVDKTTKPVKKDDDDDKYCGLKCVVM